jgi:tetratricopeptide (TPR) repeat protein
VRTTLLTGRSIALLGSLGPAALSAQSYQLARKMWRPPACDSVSAGSRKIAMCNEVLLRKPDSVRPRMALAEEFLRDGRWLDAAKEFRTAAAYDSAATNSSRDSVISLLAAKRFNLAINAMASESTWYLTAGLQPQTASLIQAKALRALGRDTAALSVLQRATYLAQTDARVQLELGDAFAKLGYKEPALRAYQIVLSRTDDSTFGARAWGGMARVSAISGRPAIASEYWSKALRLDPSYFVSRDDEALAFQASRKGTGMSKQSGQPIDTAKRVLPQRPPGGISP